jgi:hypothetical protein
MACHIRPASSVASVWLSGIVCADLLVSFLRVLLALPGMHHHLWSRLTRLKQGSFPPARLCCPCYHQYYEPLRLLIRLLSGFRFISLYQRFRWVWTIDRMRSLLFRRLLSPHPVPPYAGEFFGVAFPGSSRLPWPSLRMTSSALPCSPLRANLSALQDSLYVAGYGFALLSQEATTLQHLRSPRSTGCLLRGCLTITATGLHLGQMTLKQGKSSKGSMVPVSACFGQ